MVTYSPLAELRKLSIVLRPFPFILYTFFHYLFRVFELDLSLLVNFIGALSLLLSLLIYFLN